MELLERDTAVAAVEAALAETGRVVLVTGEAGIGKTSLVTQVARGRRFLWGVCDPLLTPRALGPIHDIAREAGIELPSGREDVFAALLGALDGSVMVVEDLHWVDEASLDAIAVVGRRIARTTGTLILTYRSDEIELRPEVASVLGALPADAVRRVPLAPLSPAAVEQLARRAGRSSARLHATTAGNPFFVNEVLNSMSPGVPPSVRDVIALRLSRLSDPARAIVELASVVPHADRAVARPRHLRARGDGGRRPPPPHGRDGRLQARARARGGQRPSRRRPAAGAGAARAGHARRSRGRRRGPARAPRPRHRRPRGDPAPRRRGRPRRRCDRRPSRGARSRRGRARRRDDPGRGPCGAARPGLDRGQHVRPPPAGAERPPRGAGAARGGRAPGGDGRQPALAVAPGVVDGRQRGGRGRRAALDRGARAARARLAARHGLRLAVGAAHAGLAARRGDRGRPAGDRAGDRDRRRRDPRLRAGQRRQRSGVGRGQGGGARDARAGDRHRGRGRPARARRTRPAQPRGLRARARRARRRAADRARHRLRA